MTDCIHTLFSAWGLSDSEDRARVTGPAIGPGFTYVDPNVSAPISDRDAYLAYVTSFGEGMPGASAEVVAVTEHHGHARATVDFCKDGEPLMRGQYFAVIQDGKVTLLAGFTGTGEPE